MSYVIAVASPASVAVAGSDARFPVHRIYCIGRNYVDHAKEMGAAVERTQPMFFMKPADAIVTDGADVAYPSATHELHHEVEMVVALRSGGGDIPVERALDCVFGYGVGLDLTRRDLQAAAKTKGHPWDVAKGFDHSAPLSTIHPVAAVGHRSQWRAAPADRHRPDDFWRSRDHPRAVETMDAGTRRPDLHRHTGGCCSVAAWRSLSSPVGQLRHTRRTHYLTKPSPARVRVVRLSATPDPPAKEIFP